MKKGEEHRSKSITRHLLFVADLLRGREHDRHSLAARLGIQPAQADRLINAALDHLPGISKVPDGKQRKVKMDAAAFTPAPSYPTAVAACFGSSLWPLFEGTTYATGIRDATKHVIGRTKRRAVFKDIDRKFWFLRRGGEVALLDRAPLLDEILEAVLHHRALSLEYTRFGGVAERVRVEPLSVALHDHQLYVVARDEGRRLHPYRFARIRAAQVLDATFEYPSRNEYDPEQLFRDSFGIFLDGAVEEVVLKLDEQWTTYAQSHRWHPTQKVDVAPDHVIVRMRVRICPEVIAWILGFGADAEVLAPEGLRKAIAQRALALGRIYGSSMTPGLRKAARQARPRNASATVRRR